MMKLFLLLVLLVGTLFSKSYHFKETRYSDAFEASTSLDGIIRFKENSLKINYQSSDTEIVYEDADLVIKQNSELLDIDENQRQSMSSFFEILLMIYHNDESVLKEHFEVKHQENKTLLNPKGDLSQYIEKLTLVKHEKQLKEVKLFLKNADIITISIEDEIR